MANVGTLVNQKFKIITDGTVVKTQYFGEVQLETIEEVLATWCELKNQNSDFAIFLFDYTLAKMSNINYQDAITIANHPIFQIDQLEDTYIVGVLADRKDYAIACLWASQLFNFQTFPRENVFLHRTVEDANQTIAALVSR